jgi:hypothetical protein
MLMQVATPQSTITAPIAGAIAADLLLYANFCEVMAGTHDFAKAATPKKKNCNPAKSHLCTGKKGIGSCVSLAKKCVIPAKGAALQAANAINAAIDAAKPPGLTVAEAATSQSAGIEVLGLKGTGLAMVETMIDMGYTPEEVIKAETENPGSAESGFILKFLKQNQFSQQSKWKQDTGDFMVDPSKPWVASKVKKMQKLGMTEAEALAVASWTSQEMQFVPGSGYKTKYSLMNQAIYAKGSLPADLQAKIEATNQLAIQGYEKVQSITPKAVAAAAAKKYEVFDPAAPLQKHIEISDNPAAFVQKYQDAIGGEITEDTHFGTTHLSKLDWVEATSNITYEVTPKWDGTGRGKYIDDFKNGASEGEIMFIPGTKFKVKGVLLPNTGTPPTKPDTIADEATLANIQNAVAEAQMGGGGWKANYKAAHGKAAFDALPATAKAVNSKKALAALVESNKTGLAAHKAAMAEYAKAGQSNRYIIQLEEI